MNSFGKLPNEPINHYFEKLPNIKKFEKNSTTENLKTLLRQRVKCKLKARDAIIAQYKTARCIIH